MLTAADARAVGLDRRRVEAAVRRGQLRRLWRGAWIAADAPPAARLRALVAVAPDAVLCGASAARLHGLGVPADWPDEIAVAPSAGHVRTRPGLTVRARVVPIAQRTRHLGLPVTTLGRTVLDVGMDRPETVAQWLVDQALDRGLMPSDVPLVTGRRGTATVARMLVRGDPASGSALVSALRCVLDLVPGPNSGCPIVDRSGRVRLRADLGWPHRRVAVLLGDQDDRDVRDRAAGCGWLVLGAGWADADDPRRLRSLLGSVLRP